MPAEVAVIVSPQVLTLYSESPTQTDFCGGIVAAEQLDIAVLALMIKIYQQVCVASPKLQRLSVL